jgi:cell wall-associated NlpC family hydrolase
VSAVFVISTLFTSNIWAKELNKGTVKENTLAYNTPSSEAEGNVYLNQGEELDIVEDIDNYYGVLIENDEIVYIQKEYIDVEITEEEPVKPVETVIKNEVKQLAKGEAVVNYAKQFIGLRYVSGGNSLTNGVDCSGFTKQVYAKFNVSLERRSRDQFASDGRSVSRADLAPGDLVFYGVGGSVRHVAIYVGNDQIIHAPVPGKSVCIVPIKQRGDDPIIGYKRIF